MDEQHPSPVDRAAKRAFKAAMDEIYDVAHSARMHTEDAQSAVQWLDLLESLMELASSTIAHFDRPVEHVYEPDPQVDEPEDDAPTLAASEAHHAS